MTRKTIFRLLTAGAISAVSIIAAADTRVVDAVKDHNKDSLRSLVKEHVDVNAPEPDGTSALHWAAHSNDLESVQILLRAGANAKAASRYGVTPLSEAATYGNAALVDALLKAGADPNTLSTERGETVLMTASRAGNADAVKVAAGAWRGRECEREFPRADGADVGGG